MFVNKVIELKATSALKLYFEINNYTPTTPYYIDWSLVRFVENIAVNYIMRFLFSRSASQRDNIVRSLTQFIFHESSEHKRLLVGLLTNDKNN
jgi:hypothetical protein